MKKISLLFLGLVFLFAACGDDREVFENSLRHDGANDNSPALPADTYEAAARFPAAITRSYVGQKLTQVSYFMAGTPQQTTLRIYSGGTASAPGSIVYEASLTGSITQNAFNAHVLDTPLDITGEDLWISIRFRQNRTIQIIGCDAGPKQTGGDMFFAESENSWTTFEQFAAGESINWNIRGVVE